MKGLKEGRGAAKDYREHYEEGWSPSLLLYGAKESHDSSKR